MTIITILADADFNVPILDVQVLMCRFLVSNVRIFFPRFDISEFTGRTMRVLIPSAKCTAVALTFFGAKKKVVPDARQ